MTPAFAELLRGGRAEYNHRYVLAAQRWPGIEPAAFGELLGGPVDALVAAVAKAAPSAAPAAANALYDITLSLLGQRWIGPAGRAPRILQGWEVLGSRAPVLLGLQPAVLLTGVANALVHWSAHGGGQAWIDTLAALAARARSPEELLRAAQVAAWRHGMAQYRDSALERTRSLERELLAICFGLPLAQWQDGMLERLRSDRWYRPDAIEAERPRVATRVGAFVGFGGRFAEPPLVALVDGEPLLHAAGARYSLHVDAYGACVQPHGEGKLAAAFVLPTGWRVDGGRLHTREQTLPFLEQGPITSAVAQGDSLVLTHAYAHAATVLALPV